MASQGRGNPRTGRNARPGRREGLNEVVLRIICQCPRCRLATGAFFRSRPGRIRRMMALSA